jgi:hypothetical protein
MRRGHPGSDAPTTAARATRSVSRCGDCGDVYNTRLVHSCNTRTHGSTHRVSQHSQTHEPSATRASLSSPYYAPWPRISYFLGMCSVDVEDDIVRRGFAIEPEHGSRCGDCVHDGFAIGPKHGSRCGDCVDDGFAIGPEHGSRCGDCVDDGGLWCSFGSHRRHFDCDNKTGGCDDGCAAEMKASFSPMS